jgi:hypothetical protein
MDIEHRLGVTTHTPGTSSPLRGLIWPLVVAVVAMVATVPLAAQTRAVVVDVTVIDVSGTPLPGVDLTLHRLSARDVLIATTDQRGMHRFETKIDSGTMSLVARKVGYSPFTEEFQIDSTGTSAIKLVLSRATVVLDTTRVSADVLRSKNYFIGTNDIKNSSRYIGDALDAVSKIHPEMLGDGYRLCPGVQYIWINGQRVYSPWKTTPTMRAPSRVSAAGVRERAPATSGNIRDRLDDLGPPNVPQILASVHVEHLSEIRYVNCWDKSMPGVGGQDALYIVLKPGVKWDLKRGSQVVDSSRYRKAP